MFEPDFLFVMTLQRNFQFRIHGTELEKMMDYFRRSICDEYVF